ncbi:MAG: U32 family peptidase [Clostridiales bacterium]|jgi:putative protease|nr:U32 family peptidase [Clostridiales bacterium]
MDTVKKPELLAPAGDFEKLRAALSFGADAVYLGGAEYSLRSKAKNFDAEGITQAVKYAHGLGRKVYVTVNIYARNEDFKCMYDFLIKLRCTGADAVIVSDPGVFSLVKEIIPDMDIHISTQANTTNYRAAAFWAKAGAKRAVLARELSIAEIEEIRRATPAIELEAFVHGAMCMAYSGRCLLSHYLTGRGANRGECAHPCRYKYALMEETRLGEYFPIEEDSRGAYIMSSKDLCLIEYIPQLIASGVSSFKIEGRMKSVYYTAAAVKAYRCAIDDYFNDPELYESNKGVYLSDLFLTAHRDFTTGFFTGKLNESIRVHDGPDAEHGSDFCGIVKSYDADSNWAVVEQRGKFGVGEELEFLTAEGSGFRQIINEMFDLNSAPLQNAPHPRQLLRIRAVRPVRELDILRRRVSPFSHNN